MSTAYNIGLVFGALTSALVVSRVLFWLSRSRLEGWSRALFANGASFVLIVVVSIVVRRGLELDAFLLHLATQAAWLALDLMVEKRAA